MGMLRKLVPSSGDQDQLAAFVDRLPIGLIASGAELDRVDQNPMLFYFVIQRDKLNIQGGKYKHRLPSPTVHVASVFSACPPMVLVK